MSGLSNSPKRDASTRSIPVPGGEIAKSIASGNTRRTQKRGERSYQLKCDIRDAGVGGLTKKCAKQSKQRARPELLWLLETEDNGGMGFPAAKRHNCGAGSRAQLAESRAATQDHHYRGLIDGGVGFVEGSLGQVHGRRGQSQCQQNQFPNQDCPTKTPHFRSQRRSTAHYPVDSRLSTGAGCVTPRCFNQILEFTNCGQTVNNCRPGGV